MKEPQSKLKSCENLKLVTYSALLLISCVMMGYWMIRIESLSITSFSSDILRVDMIGLIGFVLGLYLLFCPNAFNSGNQSEERELTSKYDN